MTEYWDLLDENREPLGLLHRRGDALPAGRGISAWRLLRCGRAGY